MSTSVKVIATSGGARMVRTDCLFPYHNQNIQTEEDYSKMIAKIVQIETSTDAGCPVDTIIIVSGETLIDWNDYKGMKTKNGKLIIKQRENVGGSFGAFNDAFKKYDYDYWLFTEDDLIITGDKYYKKLIDEFNGDPKNGFRCLVGTSFVELGNPPHAHGGIGFTSKTVLDKVIEKYGKLPHYDGGWDYEKIIAEGEIPFTNVIHEMGYKLFGGDKGWGIENFIIPYYELTLNKLNLGCGRNYLYGYTNLDISPDVGADVVEDITKSLPFRDDTFDEVLANNVLCQICKQEDFLDVMFGLWRITKKSGSIFIRVPNANDICAFQDPMDCRRFTNQSFTYLEHGHRRYDSYGRHYGFKPFQVELLEDGAQLKFRLCPVK